MKGTGANEPGVERDVERDDGAAIGGVAQHQALLTPDYNNGDMFMVLTQGRDKANQPYYSMVGTWGEHNGTIFIKPEEQEQSKQLIHELKLAPKTEKQLIDWIDNIGNTEASGVDLNPNPRQDQELRYGYSAEEND